MRWRIDWSVEASMPARAAVLCAAELPEDAAVPPRIAAIVDEALEIYRRLAEPRGVVAVVDQDEFAAIHRGEGRNEPDTPLGHVLPRAGGLALYVATVGAPLGVAIRDLFEAREPALGYLLDAVASEAADALSYAAARDWRDRLDAAGRLGPDSALVPYSPGYCGWDVTGQRALFAALRPEDIDVTLNDSCLMQPLKSVSGVIVSAPSAVHEFDQVFPCCAECGTRHCQGRPARARA